jgi:hypothetical protein
MSQVSGPAVRASGLSIIAALVMTGCGGDAPASPAAPTPGPQSPAAAGCARTSVGFAPLTDLAATYQGFAGGLYPGGANQRPAAHEAAGLALARAIAPVDGSGAPAAGGRYVLLSIGMSNTTQEFSTFKPMGDAEPGRDPSLVIVDGAQGGVTATDWMSASCPCYGVVDGRLRSAGVTPAQVVVAWIKLADRQPSEGWPAHTLRLKSEIATVLQVLESRFTNLRLAYLSSRIYAGYATTTLNPEPYAYESGFAVKWIIDEQIAGSAALNYDAARGPVRAPWVAWGPYLWADGLAARSDGLTWACGDFESDGTHPSASGRRKVAERLLGFFRTDSIAREWFYR